MLESRRPTLNTSLLALLWACCGLLVSTDAGLLRAQTSMQDDLLHRNPAIHWPSGYNPASAPLFSHNDLLVPAACEKAFRHLTNAEAWPTWLVFAKDVQTPRHAPLQKATTFSWSIFGKPLRSTVEEYQPDRQIGWLKLASHYYQAWLFEPKGTGCRVTTEEISVGESATQAAAIGDVRTHRAHDLWLASLRWIAEGGTDVRVATPKSASRL